MTINWFFIQLYPIIIYDFLSQIVNCSLYVILSFQRCNIIQFSVTLRIYINVLSRLIHFRMLRIIAWIWYYRAVKVGLCDMLTYCNVHHERLTVFLWKCFYPTLIIFFSFKKCDHYFQSLSFQVDDNLVWLIDRMPVVVYLYI